jgi:hypothetical protein
MELPWEHVEVLPYDIAEKSVFLLLIFLEYGGLTPHSKEAVLFYGRLYNNWSSIS